MLQTNNLRRGGFYSQSRNDSDQIHPHFENREVKGYELYRFILVWAGGKGVRQLCNAEANFVLINMWQNYKH